MNDNVKIQQQGQMEIITLSNNARNGFQSYCKSIMDEMGELLTIIFAEDISVCTYVFLIKNSDLKYRIIRVPCIEKEIQSISKYFAVAEIYEYELSSQYNILVNGSSVNNNYRLTPPKHQVDLNIHHEKSHIRFIEVGIGFHYRYIEQKMLNKTPEEILLEIPKIFNTCTMAHQIAFVGAIEQILGVDIPQSTAYSRMIIAELERVKNHLLWMTMLFLGTGSQLLAHNFMLLHIKTENILKDLQAYSHTAVRYQYPAYNFDSSNKNQLEIQLLELLGELNELKENQQYKLVINFFSNIGNISREESIKDGNVGPIARASNNLTDTRINSPYLLYDKIDFSIVNKFDGSLKEIAEIKVDEIYSSISILQQILKKCDPWTVHSTEIPPIFPQKISIINVEAPNGRMTYFLRTNTTGKLVEFRITIPSITNFISIIKQLLDSDIKWIPLITRLFDMGIDPLDYLILIDLETGNSDYVPAHQIRTSTITSIQQDIKSNQ